MNVGNDEATGETGFPEAQHHDDLHDISLLGLDRRSNLFAFT
jgi:hypothetical protein